MAVYQITLSKSNWSGGTDALWYDTVSQAFFFDAYCTQEATAIEPPTRESFRFTGYFSASSGGTQYIDEEGNFTDALLSLSITSAKTFYAQGAQVSYKLTLNDNNGSGGGGALYFRIDGGGYFANDLCEGDPVSSVTKPGRTNYAFDGYYNGTGTLGDQYIDKDGNFTAALDALVLTAAKSIYARWVAPYKITISANSGTGGTAVFWYDSVSGGFFADNDLSEPITAIVPHTRECHAFLGCYSANNTTSTERVAANGTIATDWTPTGATTIYAQWARVSWPVTLNKSSGTGGDSLLYYKIDGGGYFTDDLCTQQTHAVEPPTRNNYAFTGYFSSSSGGSQYILSGGTFRPAFEELTITRATTIYAQWKAAYKITFNKASGAGGTDAIWYSVNDNAFFADARLTIPAASVTPPTRECFRFDGYYNSASGTTQYIDADGEYTAALSSLSITSPRTFVAHWTRVSYKATLDDNGGTGGSGAFYFDGESLAFYADDQLTTQITAVGVPTRSGYDFIGYYATRIGGSKYVDAAGEIVVATALTANLTIYARWQGHEYTLSFDYNGGSEGIASKTVTFGQPIGALPTTTRVVADFDGWYIGGNVVGWLVSGGVKIDKSTVWNIADDATAVASWFRYFGGVKDWFGLASANLIPISSDSGDNRQRICCANATSLSGGGAGRYSAGVSETSGIWRNPSVTYRVVGDCTIETQLGKAFAATKSGGVMTISGYMITAVKVSAAIGKFPTVTVQATANEGANAINLFAVSIPVTARARAQYLMGAVEGGGNLQTCEVEAKCEPVVVAENNMPCASDVVHGRYTARAETLTPTNGAAPTAANGFTAVGEPQANGDTEYPGWSITAEKEIT